MFSSISQNKLIRFSFIVFFFLLISLIFCIPLLKDIDSSCSGDWDYFYTLYEVLLISVLEYHQFPLWNPYCGGGMPLIGNPQAGIPSVTFLISAILGVINGLKISVWFHTFLGLLGMWLLGGYFKLRFFARLAPCFVFIFSSTWALHIAAGHFTWLPTAFLPFLFLAFLKGIENFKWSILASLISSFMLLSGGTYIFAFSILFIFVYTICYMIENKNFYIIFNFIAINALSLGLSAFKVIPTLELLSNNPRITSVNRPLPLTHYLTIFFDRSQHFQSVVNNLGWWEFGSYLGVIVISLYIFNLLLFRTQRPLLVSSIFFLIIAFGAFSDFSPWVLLHKLPFFNHFKIPTRILIVFSFSVALIIGLSLERLQKDNKISSKIIVGLLTIFIMGDLFMVSSPILNHAVKPIPFFASFYRHQGVQPDEINIKLYTIKPTEKLKIGQSIKSHKRPFSQTTISMLQRNKHGAWSDQYLPLLQNQGVINAYETIPFHRFPTPYNSNDYRGEFYFLGLGKPNLILWSPNKLVFQIKNEWQDRLIINQNHWKGWKASHGSISKYKGLMAVDLPAGEYMLSVRYLPNSFLLGCFLSITTLIGILLILFVISGKKQTIKHIFPLRSKTN